MQDDANLPQLQSSSMIEGLPRASAALFLMTIGSIASKIYWDLLRNQDGVDQDASWTILNHSEPLLTIIGP